MKEYTVTGTDVCVGDIIGISKVYLPQPPNTKLKFLKAV